MIDKFRDKENNPFKDIEVASDFSEIYLFFDYDFHNINYPLEELNRQISEMLNIFDNETENGKLYINYPMIESIRYTKELPDSDYNNYIITRDECHKFKKIAAEFSFYNSLDFIQIDKRKEPNEAKLAMLIINCECLKKQNVFKANLLCCGKSELPKSKEDISQIRIFENQLINHILNNPSRIAILNSFPLFLYDYFK